MCHYWWMIEMGGQWVSWGGTARGSQQTSPLGTGEVLFGPEMQ